MIKRGIAGFVYREVTIIVNSIENTRHRAYHICRAQSKAKMETGTRRAYGDVMACGNARENDMALLHSGRLHLRPKPVAR